MSSSRCPPGVQSHVPTSPQRRLVSSRRRCLWICRLPSENEKVLVGMSVQALHRAHGPSRRRIHLDPEPRSQERQAPAREELLIGSDARGVSKAAVSPLKVGVESQQSKQRRKHSGRYVPQPQTWASEQGRSSAPLLACSMHRRILSRFVTHRNTSPASPSTSSCGSGSFVSSLAGNVQ